MQVLRRKIRSDHGQHPSVGPKLAEVLALQYRQHPSWSYQLHADNLAVRVEQQTELGPMPAYVTVVRFMKSHGLFKRPRRGPVHSPGAQAAERRYETRKIRSYESEYVHALWHLDFHHGSQRVLLSTGQWVYPLLLGILEASRTPPKSPSLRCRSKSSPPLRSDWTLPPTANVYPTPCSNSVPGCSSLIR